MKLSNILLFALFFLIALGPDTRAYAYLDPGTGSMLIQMLLGGVAGVLVVGKLYWSRIKTFFHIGSPKDRSGDTASRSDAQ